jgi:predicted transglutaminase-like cysteine proteinase
MVSLFAQNALTLRTGFRARTVAALAFVIAGLVPAHGQMMRLDAIPMAKIDRDGEPFGRATNFAPAGPLWIKWQGVDAGISKDEIALERCRADKAACSPAMTRLSALIAEASALEGRHRFAVVNRAINLAVAYTSDERQFGRGDVWSSPAATLASGRGDCEDYAIAKMFALRASGVAAQDLRLLVARVRGDNDIHAVLAARHDGHWYLLDNRSMVLVEDHNSRDLMPLFAMDAGGVRQFGERVMTVAAKTAKPESQPAMMPASAPAFASAGFFDGIEPSWLAL